MQGAEHDGPQRRCCDSGVDDAVQCIADIEAVLSLPRASRSFRVRARKVAPGAGRGVDDELAASMAAIDIDAEIKKAVSPPLPRCLVSLAHSFSQLDEAYGKNASKIEQIREDAAKVSSSL